MLHTVMTCVIYLAYPSFADKNNVDAGISLPAKTKTYKNVEVLSISVVLPFVLYAICSCDTKNVSYERCYKRVL